MGWLQRRRDKKELAKATDSIFQMIVMHIEKGGTLESLLVTPLFEKVEWDLEKQSWAIVVVEGGASWENGLEVSDKLEKGRRVSLMSGRGGRTEDALVVSGRKVAGGYKYLLDFTETGGAEPWFLANVG